VVNSSRIHHHKFEFYNGLCLLKPNLTWLEGISTWFNSSRIHQHKSELEF